MGKNLFPWTAGKGHFVPYHFDTYEVLGKIMTDKMMGTVITD